MRGCPVIAAAGLEICRDVVRNGFVQLWSGADNAFPRRNWDSHEDLARDHGALLPDRLITSAKSWLSNFHIDPKKPVLPWKSDIKEQKLSAFDCSRLYLEHMKEGFLYAERAQGHAWNLAEGQVVLTVPASFDEVARNLTAAAADAAGFGKVVLLEEPQAAFYAWTAQAGSDDA